MGTTDEHDLSFVEGEQIEKDWSWWSNFLQREYYGGPEEETGWKVAAGAVAAAVELQDDMSALDLGSGCGEMVMQLARRGARAFGIEQSLPLVEHCRREANSRGLQAEFIPADMFTFEPEQTFDLILSLNTSFGFGSDEQNRALIGKIGRWLKPGGIFYLDLITADCAEEFGTWNDELDGGRLVVDNTYDQKRRLMISYPTWVSPDNTIYTVDRPEIVQLYLRADIEEMMEAADMAPARQRQAMGRRYHQSDDQMQTTWISRKNSS